MRPGLPKCDDSEWVTSPAQGWRAEGGSEQRVNRRGGRNQLERGGQNQLEREVLLCGW